MTAPLWGSSTLACRSEWDNGGGNSCLTQRFCVSYPIFFFSVRQRYQQDQRRHRRSSRDFPAALHHLCVRLLHWLRERMEVNSCHRRSKSADRHRSWSHGSGETRLLLIVTYWSFHEFSISFASLGSPPVCGQANGHGAAGLRQSRSRGRRGAVVY